MRTLRSADARTGFGVAPILYMLGLVGVGAGILFSSYSQNIKSNIAMTNSLGVESDLNSSLTTLAASSVLGNDGMTLCPPKGGSPGSACADPSVNTKMTDLASVLPADPHLPVIAGGVAGTAAEVGVFTSGAGVKQVDPWGHYYIYCRWENNPTSAPSSPAIQILSAGAGGTLNTACGAPTAAAGNYAALMNQSNTINRASVWQAGTVNGTSGITYGAGEQLKADVNGNLFVPGMIVGSSTISAAGNISSGGEVSGASALFGPIAGTTGIFTSNLSASGVITGSSSIAATGAISADSGAFTTGAGGTLSAANGAFAVDTTGGITVGSSLFTVSGSNGNTATSGTFVATGAVALGSTLTATGLTTIGSTTPITAGSAQPLLTVGKKVGNAWPFEVDQNGNVLSTGSASTLAGAFNGSFSGSVAASSITDSGTLGVTGTTNLTGQLNGSSAVFSGSVTAASFIGSIALGGGGSSVTGVLPIANGGTGASDATTALANLGVTSGGHLNTALLTSNLIPGADLVNGSVDTNQLATTGVSPGTYTTVTVDAQGRVTYGTFAPSVSPTTITDGTGDLVTVGSNGVAVTLGSSAAGFWNATGIIIGTSGTALNKLDVYGGAAIGTSYAGTKAAPTNGLIVVGSVGIGTSAPISALQVNGTITAAGFAGSGVGLTGIGSVGNGSSGQVAYYPSSGTTVVGTSTINISGGNVGIGMTSPGSQLQVNGAAAIGYATSTAAPTNGLAVAGAVGIGSTAPIDSLDMSQQTDAIALPSGSTGQRPSSTVNGQIRYNNSTSAPGVEALINGTWLSLLSTSATVGTGQLTGIVQVPNGGTGDSALTANVLYKGSGLAPMVASSLTDTGSTVSTTESFTNLQSIGTISTDGLVLSNTTAAAAGAQQYSPRLHFTGQGWKTNSTAASQSVDFIEENQPQQGAANPTGNLTWSSSVNAGSYNPLMTLTSGGFVGIGTTLPATQMDIQGVGTVVLNLSTSGYETDIDLNNTSASGRHWRIGSGGSSGGFASGLFGFYDVTASKMRMIIDASGNVGIGTTSPNALLDIGSLGATRGIMRLEGSTSGYVQLQPSAAAGSWTMTLPTSVGTSGYVLQTDGTGVTSWTPLAIGTGSLSGTIQVANGGTGDTTLTAHGLLVGEGTAAAAVTAAGAANTVLVGNGSSSDPTFSASPTLSGVLTDLQSIGTTSTDGLVLSNTTAAAAGAQQYSPRLHFTGRGWETGTAASQSVDFIEENQPQQGAANPTGNLTWSSSVNAGSYNQRMTLTSGGNLGIGTTSPNALLDVGNQASISGTLRLESSAAGGFYTQIQPSISQTASYTLTLPTAAPSANGYVLSSTMGGVMSWTATNSAFSGLTSGDFCTAASATSIQCSTAASGSGSVVLANSPSIGTATLTGTVTLSGLTTAGVVETNGSGVLSSVATLSTIYGGLGGNFGASSGALSISAGTVSAGTLSVANGGTGQATAAAARASSGLDIDEMTTHGDSVYAMAATDRMVATSATLTAARTWTLPAASAVNAGQQLCILDKAGGVSAPNTLTIARNGTDTIKGGTSYILSAAYTGVCLVSDGVSAWQPAAEPSAASNFSGILAVANGGTGETTLTAHSVMLGEGAANVGTAGPGSQYTVLVGNGSSSDPTFSASPTLSGVLTDLQSIGTTSTDGLVLSNTTAAAAGAQQYSPRLHFTGQGWETGTGASQSVDFIQELQSTQSTTSAATGNLVWSNAINGGSYSPLMTLSSAGNLGIGSGQIETPAGSVGAPSYSFTNDPTTGLYYVSVGSAAIAANGVQAMIIGSTQVKIPSGTNSSSVTTGALVLGGGVGIQGNVNVLGNITNPAAINGQHFTATIAATGSYTSSGSTAYPTGTLSYLSSQSGHIYTNAFSGYTTLTLNTTSKSQYSYFGAFSNEGTVYTPTMVFGVSTGSATYAERMRIDQNGVVGIGTTAMSSSNLLEVNGAAAIGYTNAYGGSAGGLIVSGNVGIGSASPVYPLDVVGDIRTSTCLRYASSTLGICSSDERIKRDIKPFAVGLSAVTGLKPVTFYYNGLAGNPDDGHIQIGFIAQDVEKAVPSMVSTHAVKLHRDDKTLSEIKAVDYGEVSYMLVNAIKELKNLFDSEQSDVAKLKAANDNQAKAIEELRTMMLKQNQAFEEYKKAHK